MSTSSALQLAGRRILLRPLVEPDYDQWREVRTRCREWLLKWEPRPPAGQRDVVEDPRVFSARCGARERERILGSGFGFGLFVGDRFAGEVNLTAIQRGPFQNAYVGYWVDRDLAGQGYVPEALVVLFGFAFEDLELHRLQISIIPRNLASRRVVEKLGIRQEGVAVRYLQIDGRWEDHVRYALTVEEWMERRERYRSEWL